MIQEIVITTLMTKINLKLYNKKYLAKKNLVRMMCQFFIK